MNASTRAPTHIRTYARVRARTSQRRIIDRTYSQWQWLKKCLCLRAVVLVLCERDLQQDAIMGSLQVDEVQHVGSLCDQVGGERLSQDAQWWE